jgi:hypothetical protein
MNHKTHLSCSPQGWVVIHQGSPLCDYKKTMEEALVVAKQFNCSLPDVTWHDFQWVSTKEICKKF